MLHSFFPNPRIFFPSALIVAILAIVFWYYEGATIGATLGLPWPEDGTPPVIGNGFYFTNNFLTFYFYFFGVSGVFLGAWQMISRHPWARWSLWGSLFIVFMTFFSVQVSVNLNNWSRPFFDNVIAMLGGDIAGDASILYRGVYDFLAIAMVAVFSAVILNFFTSHYVFRWRTALNDFYISKWSQVNHIEGASQRVQEDTKLFAGLLESIGSKTLDSVITLIAFLPILAELSQYVPSLPLIGDVPYALVWAAVGWSLFGTFLLFVVGVKLPGLEFKNQRVEASYRKELVLGEDDDTRAEVGVLRGLYDDLRRNYFRLYFHYTYFNLARVSYLQVDNVFVLVLVIPSIVAMSFTYGIFQQISRAFGQVAASFQLLVQVWPSVIDLLSVRKRLVAFERAIDGEELPEIDQEFLESQSEN